MRIKFIVLVVMTLLPFAAFADENADKGYWRGKILWMTVLMCICQFQQLYL